MSQTIHNVCCEDEKFKLFDSLFHSVYFVFPKSLFSFGDLFAVRHLWVTCNEDKCCVVDTARGRHSRRSAYLLYLFMRSYCNFESKQGNSITLLGRAQMIPFSHWTKTKHHYWSIASNSCHYSCPRSVYCRSIVFLLVVQLFEIYRFIMKIFAHIPHNRWDKYRKRKVSCTVSARFYTAWIKTFSVSRIVYFKSLEKI